MAFPWAVAAFLAVFVFVVILLIRSAGVARRAHAAQEAAQDSPGDGLLLRFVEDEGGRRVGETVAVEGADLVLKDAQGFLVVPITGVEENGPGLRLRGALDEAQARAKGNAWREKSHKLISYDPSELPPEDRKA